MADANSSHTRRGEGTSRTVLRRLNRYEYHNTLRDILGLGTLPFDLTSDFPADEESHGFTNIGDVLNLSDRHLDAYLGLADRYLRIAFPIGEPQQAKTLVVKPQDWGYPDREARTPWMYRLHVKDKYLDIGAGKKQLSDHFALGTYPNEFTRWSGGIQESGYYTISITAEAIRRLTHPYDPKMIPVDLRPPMQLGLYLSQGLRALPPMELRTVFDSASGTYSTTSKRLSRLPFGWTREISFS